MKWYNEEVLKNDIHANFGRTYQQCTLSVMDTIADPDITFDEKGICNYYYDYLEAEKKTVFNGEIGAQKFRGIIEEIKKKGKGQQYDCILGVSGGVDSSYLAYLCKREQLRPLLVHFDNGWNSELAVNNIQNLVKKCGFDLYTYVMDWEEFKEVQKAYFRASVLDLEIPTDHFIFGALFEIAKKYKINTILSGWNTRTEFVMPKSFFFSRKFDALNLLDIVKKYGKLKKISKLPLLSFSSQLYNSLVRKTRLVSLLNYIDYNKAEVKEVLKSELEWRDYGGKHYESVFTRFYQGYILPVKFNIDKRKCHLSNLIFSGQLSRQEALEELKQPPYDPALQKLDFEYVAKKLDFTLEEFQAILETPPRSHYDFKTTEKYWKMYLKVVKLLKPLQLTFSKRADGRSKHKK
ncbi:MAG: N-acetyl sugar amidotransferase [Sphingobacteriales bacterium]|uniref:N-acetyl sugar amidotransferase n=1 Tax=uncultured Dysgonomonas sp. TaxID=206096 RepID=UPI000B2353C2|nr:N-acetyl sugar amidotransferase [uncultured Dysgonomonas sp.]MBN8858104.1 N-acetyl sugar amidotransferase [Sphingobacteriales bacterium]